MRVRVEHASVPVLTRLATLPPWLPFLAMLVLILVGSWVGGAVGTVLIGLAALVVAWLLYLSWPRLTPPERMMRLAVLALVVAVAITRLF
jgi:hypothetical protein